MFEITHEIIKQYASLRNVDAHVMPMYVFLYNERYPLDELDTITDYSPNSIKVGFVSVISPIEKRPCTLGSMYEVNVIESFVEHDDSTGVDTTYLLFETGIIEGNGDIYEQINYYISALDERIKTIANNNKLKLREKIQQAEQNEYSDYYS